MQITRVRDVDGVLIRTETDTIWPFKSVRYNSAVTCLGIKSVDLIWEFRFLPEILLVRITRIRKPYGPVLSNDHVVWRIEIPSLIVCDKSSRRRAPWHMIDSPSPRCSCALRTEDDRVIEVVYTAIGHINTSWRPHFHPFYSVYRAFPTSCLRAVQLHAGYEDCGEVGALGGLEQVRGNVQFVVYGNEDACLVPERIVGRFGGGHEEGVGWLGPDERGERSVMDEDAWLVFGPLERLTAVLLQFEWRSLCFDFGCSTSFCNAVYDLGNLSRFVDF